MSYSISLRIIPTRQWRDTGTEDIDKKASKIEDNLNKLDFVNCSASGADSMDLVSYSDDDIDTAGQARGTAKDYLNDKRPDVLII
jgi:hypothetical protein